jgi:N-sulfoglucosamine sulfohydrolase
MPLQIDQDFFISNTFQDLLYRTRHNISTHWYKNLKQYYYREQWELYDLLLDSKELINQFRNEKYETVINQLTLELYSWQNATSDAWICSPTIHIGNNFFYFIPCRIHLFKKKWGLNLYITMEYM